MSCFILLTKFLIISQVYMLILADRPFADLNGEPSLKIPQGVLVGSYRYTVHNVSYVAFEGVPYAQPPLEGLRFKAPLQWGKWKGIYNATQKGPLCVQFNLNPAELSIDIPFGEEDCLYLNVYIPAVQSKEKLPILVFLHGGNFVSGDAGIADPGTMMEQSIVFVGISYRLNVFGFLNLNTSEVPGNAGLKDQVMALRWLQANAKYFNGDKDRVTVIGESAGAASAMFHQLSPMSRGLFHQTIAIGGSALNGWAIQEHALEKLAGLAKILGLDANSPSFLSDLRRLDAHALRDAAFLVPSTAVGYGEDFVWTPTIEIKRPKQEAFLTEKPLQSYLTNNFYMMPTIIGCTNKEFANFFALNAPVPFSVLLRQPNAVVPLEWQLLLTEKGKQRVYKKIVEYFFEGQEIDLTIPWQAERAIDLASDVFIQRNVDRTVRVLIRQTKEPIYQYRFSYRGGLNAKFNEAAGVQGASHIDEIYYLWTAEQIPVDDYSSDGWVRRRIVALFTNFVKLGNPTPGPCNDLLPTTWLPVSRSTQHYMSIGGDVIPSVDPSICTLKFWRDLERRIYAGYYK